MLGLSTAHAADPTLTLACQGTVTVTSIDDAKPEPISVGIILNFTTHTVQGFGDPTKITGMNDTTITFSGSNPPGQASKWNILGSLDRVTGALEAITQLSSNGRLYDRTSYSLKCKPTQRMF
jgi:hypothetical protein